MLASAIIHTSARIAEWRSRARTRGGTTRRSITGISQRRDGERLAEGSDGQAELRITPYQTRWLIRPLKLYTPLLFNFEFHSSPELSNFTHSNFTTARTVPGRAFDPGLMAAMPDGLRIGSVRKSGHEMLPTSGFQRLFEVSSTFPMRGSHASRSRPTRASKPITCRKLSRF